MVERVLSSLKEHWDHLLKEGQELSFRKGQALFYEGHVPYGIFVLRSGKVQFVRGDDSCGEEPHLVQASKGKIIGLSHFFEESPFCCTCVALSDCKLTFISKTQLHPFKMASQC
ncbi:MAG: cyclic nucleotide-binding domain-containing protein [Deltaproteobacteria bacterium]|nr:cyclic nucleotide-binding domain-containing protein [Deltaproteobacteria bacterium]